MHARDAEPPVRPPFLDPVVLLLVLAGGAVGTGLRAVLTEVFPIADGAWPWATFAVNIVGSFLLGLLVALLSVRVAAPPHLRAGLGAGLLGGFTTYSAFAVEVDRLVSGDEVWLALGYAAGSVLVGVLAAAFGVLVGGGIRPLPGADER